MILKKYLPHAIIGIGEGEIVMGDMYQYIMGSRPLREVRNILYIENGQIRQPEKQYLDTKLIALPDRSNSEEFYKQRGEVYIEGSRGCAFGKCSFCTCCYSLGSIKENNKWRPRPIASIINDLKCLQEKKIEKVTFADEDFFGFGIRGIRRAKELADAIISNNIKVLFRINISVRSISRKTSDTNPLIREKEESIMRLKKAGLIKVFLGLESGVESQLKRYGKGFTLAEFKDAFNLLRKFDIDCELGYILLDPLITLNELKLSLKFLKENNYIQNISSVYKELRIQKGTKYIEQIHRAEKKYECKTKKKIEILGPFNFNNQEYQIFSWRQLFNLV